MKATLRALALTLSLSFVPAGCKKAEQRSPTPATGVTSTGSMPGAAAKPGSLPPPSTDQLPPGHPPVGNPPMPAGHPPMGTPGKGAAPAGEGKAVTWTLPTGWKARTPRTQMRKAEVALPGKTAADEAELIVFHFPGTGGSVDANLDRWYAQFTQPDGTPSAKKATREKRTVNGLQVTVAKLKGTFQKPKDPSQMGGPTEPAANYGLLAAIVETPEGPWFFKVIGPGETLDAQGAAFDTFVASLKR